MNDQNSIKQAIAMAQLRLSLNDGCRNPNPELRVKILREIVQLEFQAVQFLCQ